MEIQVRKGSKGKLTKIRLNKGDTIYLIGICGVAMAGLAALLKNQGFQVQGSDQNTYPPMSDQLKKTKILLFEGYKASRISKKIQLAVIGNSISSKNPEAQRVIHSDIAYASLPEMIHSFLIADKQSIVVSGTHGKTTTASMMAWLASCCGKDPSFLIGGVPNNFCQSFKKTLSEWLVIEGDEYDTAFFDKRPKFVHYQPFSVILTRIEFDHVDIYESLDQIKSSFELLIRSLPQDGYLVANADDPHVMDIIHNSSSKNIITYGAQNGSYRMIHRKAYNRKDYQELVIQCPNKEEVCLKLPVFGLHNAMNALASFALCRELKWPQTGITNGLSTFQGVKRRFQVLAETKNTILIEDFAHHPTAVKATIEALKERYPNYQIVCVFEPRSASSRRNVFQKQYVDAFSISHQVFVASPFCESEIQKEKRFSSGQLVRDLKNIGISAFLCKNNSQIPQEIFSQLKYPSVIVIMSNGPFDGIHQKIKLLIS